MITMKIRNRAAPPIILCYILIVSEESTQRTERKFKNQCTVGTFLYPSVKKLLTLTTLVHGFEARIEIPTKTVLS